MRGQVAALSGQARLGSWTAWRAVVDKWRPSVDRLFPLQNRTSGRFERQCIGSEGWTGTIWAVDDIRLGTALRQIRLRRGLRQSDVARMAGASRATILRIERGHIGTLTVDVLRRVAASLDVRIDLIARWRAGDLDRLLNARHSQFHEQLAVRFRTLPGWVSRPEVSFAIYAERGVIDVLAFHAARQMLVVIERKTDLADINELVGTIDRKRRLAVQIAQGQGWSIGPATRVAAWVIVADGATNRRRIAAHRAMLSSAFPTDGRGMAGWLLDPAVPVRALSIWSDARPGNVGAGLASVRRVSTRPRAVAMAPSRTAPRPDRVTRPSSPSPSRANDLRASI